MARHQGKNTMFALWFAYGTPSGTKLKKKNFVTRFLVWHAIGENFFIFLYGTPLGK